MEVTTETQTTVTVEWDQATGPRIQDGYTTNVKRASKLTITFDPNDPGTFVEVTLVGFVVKKDGTDNQSNTYASVITGEEARHFKALVTHGLALDGTIPQWVHAVVEHSYGVDVTSHECRADDHGECAEVRCECVCHYEAPPAS